MEVTINIERLINVLLLVALVTSTALLIYLKIQKYYLIKSMRKQWLHVPAFVKVHMRTKELFEKPLDAHREKYPNDIRCTVQFVDAADRPSLNLYHVKGDDSLTKWDEGVGLEVSKCIVQSLGQLEGSKPGIIPVLQAMLDEERDRIRAEATNNIIR